MPKELWINLPVKDLKKAKEFYAALGFSFHPRHEKSDEVAGLIIGEHKVLVMLFPESAFKSFTRNELADTRQGTEVLLSIDAQSKEELDEMIQKARHAGGAIFAEPSEQGFMYGAGFADVDGHRWNVLYMDMSQMPQT